jgi:hypothetical protein
LEELVVLDGLIIPLEQIALSCDIVDRSSNSATVIMHRNMNGHLTKPSQKKIDGNKTFLEDQSTMNMFAIKSHIMLQIPNQILLQIGSMNI